jgi:hypothetical protein
MVRKIKKHQGEKTLRDLIAETCDQRGIDIERVSTAQVDDLNKPTKLFLYLDGNEDIPAYIADIGYAN